MERLKRWGAGVRHFFCHLSPQNGLTRRWIRHAFCIIVVFLLLLQVLFSLMLRYYYLQSVERELENRAQLYRRTMELSAADLPSWGARSRELITYFTDKDKMELQVLDATGHVLLSSSGFVPYDKQVAADFTAALSSEHNRGLWRGQQESGEAVMALTVLETDAAGAPIGALRYVVSLTGVYRQIGLLCMALFLFILLIIFFVTLSGLYFINSIVTPVTAISHTARRIAMGEYDARLEKRYNDEIGELCDTINFMAGEIGTAEKMKNEFISSVSHELRTPMTAIKGWTETLQNCPDDRELIAQGLAVIGSEAERLTGIVEELLDFSRMESGHMVLWQQPLDVLVELEEAVFLFQDRAARSGITLEYCPAREVPAVMGDANRIKQVFINLLDNAVKYSRSGDRIRVEAARMPQGVQVVISDTGIGISEEELTRIRQKFYQVDPSKPGAGIGLALTEEILSLHGGSMDIDSDYGVGTTVTVMLPAATAHKRT